MSSKVTKKKVTKKTTKKLSKKTASKATNQKAAKPEEKRLTQLEMRKLQELHHAVSYATSQRNLQDQFCANIVLKIDNLSAQIKLLEYEIKRARELQQREEENIKLKSDQLQKLGNDLKLKYELNSSDSIKYDDLTGKLY